MSDELWSARLLADDPRQIQAAHTAYVRAGAQVLTTASYQATFEGFARRGLSHREAGDAAGAGVSNWRAWRAEWWPEAVAGRGDGGAGAGGGSGGATASAAGSCGGRGEPRAPPAPEVWVAASVGPYGAFLADGSEYRGRYGLSVAELERFHRPRIEAWWGPGRCPRAGDGAGCRRGGGAAAGGRGSGVPVWLSYSVAGEPPGRPGLAARRSVWEMTR